MLIDGMDGWAAQGTDHPCSASLTLQLQGSVLNAEIFFQAFVDPAEDISAGAYHTVFDDQVRAQGIKP